MPQLDLSVAFDGHQDVRDLDVHGVAHQMTAQDDAGRVRSILVPQLGNACLPRQRSATRAFRISGRDNPNETEGRTERPKLEFLVERFHEPYLGTAMRF